MISDLHTHTTYCDGDNSPEEMLLAAIEKGFKAYGFSSHSHLSYDESWNMSHAAQKDYVCEILALREKYKGKIEVLLGTEYDLLSDNDLSPFDYVIGSCHSIIKDGCYISVDHSEHNFVQCAETFYGGDYYAFAKAYFEFMSTAVNRKEFAFYGHFDLINKYNKNFKYFDENDPRYTEPMYKSLEILSKSRIPFEINTAATYRHSETQATTSAKRWLTALYELGGRVVINSDAHKRERIGYNFEAARELAKECGFKTVLGMTAKGFEEFKIT